MRSRRMAAAWFLATDGKLPRLSGNETMIRSLSAGDAERHVGGIAVDPKRQQILQALGAAHGKADPVPLIDLETYKTVGTRLEFSDQ